MVRGWSVCALLAALGICAQAGAAPVEQMVQVARHPTDSQMAVLRWDYVGDGLFFTRDGGTTWELLCGSVIEPGLRNVGRIAVTGDGKTMFGIFGGVLVDDGTGCSWSASPELADKWVTDIVNDPLDPAVTYAVSSNGDPGSTNGIYRRDAATGAWTEQGSQEAVLIGRLVVVAMGAGVRFYESIGRVQADAGTTQYSIRYSDDGGDSWTEHVYGTAGGLFRLEAVDPTNPDNVVIGISQMGADDVVLVSRDTGATFAEYLTVTQLGGGSSNTVGRWLDFAGDGRLWIGDAGELGDTTNEHGLWFATSLDEAPSKIVDTPINCVDYDARSDTVWVCSQRGFGAVDPTSGTVQEEFSMLTASAMLSCADRNIREECADQLGADNIDGICSETHFPCAPVCADYRVQLSDPTRCCDTDGGICVTTAQDAGATGGTGGGVGGAAGTPTGGGAGTAADATAGTGGDGSGAATGGSEAGMGGGETDDGCACAIPGHSPHSTPPLLLLAAGLAVCGHRVHLRRRKPGGRGAERGR